MIRGNSLPSCAATVRSACCIPVRPASVEKSVNGSLRNSGSAMSLLRILPPVSSGGLQLLSIRRMRDPRKNGWISGNLVTVRRWLGVPLALAAPSAPDLPAGLPLPPCGWSVTIYEFTACDQVADCAAALGGTRSPPPQVGPTSHDTNPGGAGGGAAKRLEASRGRR